MPLPSGPYDGRRARRKRCDHCVKRRIKCTGGMPCFNCTKTNIICNLTRKPGNAAPVFVHAARSNMTSRDSSAHVKPTSVPRIVLGGSDIYLPYFFTSFLPMNAFSSISPSFEVTLLSLVYSSLELHDATVAVSALHIAQTNRPYALRVDALSALKAYNSAVQSVQAKIVSNSFIHEPSALWTTLLLGIFELMHDNTGMSWLAHFLHGTSAILRLQGPSMLIQSTDANEQHQTFFFSARIFEIVRALVYTEHTFLADYEWTSAIETYRLRNKSSRTAMEALLDILPQFVNLAIRVLNFVSDAENMPRRGALSLARSLAQEGLDLQSALLDWCLGFLPFMDTGCDTSMALLYYLTTSIYLDGIFSYHAPFTWISSPECPALSRAVVDEYVEQILAVSHELLGQGCAGLLLFFPLRVAGARARVASTQTEILRILDNVEQRGFTVAEAFVKDLTGLWGRKKFE